MKTISTREFCSAVALVAGLMFGAHTFAADISQSKAAGWVCEQDDGYARVAKPNAPADVKAMVGAVNGQRKAKYQRIAQKNGVPVDQVARLTAKKVIGAAPQYRCN